MKGKTLLGALLVSAALGGQAFGLELLDRMLGLNTGCGTCDPCGEVAACDPVAKVCAPEPATCEPATCEPACADPCCKPRCDLFGGLKGLLACRRCGKPDGCEPQTCEPVECCPPEPESCDPVTCKPLCRKPLFPRLRGCKPACADPARCEEPECCEPACPKPACKKRCICVPNFGLLDAIGGLFKCRGCRDCRPETACCDAGTCGAAEAAAPTAAPAESEAAPLPKAPVADPSASIQKYYRGIVRN